MSWNYFLNSILMTKFIKTKKNLLLLKKIYCTMQKTAGEKWICKIIPTHIYVKFVRLSHQFIKETNCSLIKVDISYMQIIICLIPCSFT